MAPLNSQIYLHDHHASLPSKLIQVLKVKHICLTRVNTTLFHITYTISEIKCAKVSFTL